MNPDIIDITHRLQALADLAAALAAARDIPDADAEAVRGVRALCGGPRGA